MVCNVTCVILKVESGDTTKMTLLRYLKPKDRLTDPKGSLSNFLAYIIALNKIIHTIPFHSAQHIACGKYRG